MLDDFNPDDIVATVQNGLSAWFQRGDDSVNQAIIQLMTDMFLEHAGTIADIIDQDKLDNANTATLDLLAADWGTHRVDDDDDFLRLLIRLAKMKSRIGVSENDIIRFVSFVLGADPSEFHVITDRAEFDGEPNCMKITGIPQRYINDARRASFLLKSIQSIVPAEVRVVDIEYEATYKGVTHVTGLITGHTDYIIRKESVA